jgi:hypothetical protein
VTDQDPQEEECQEGDSVLFDGLWCFGHWYVQSLKALEKLERQLTADCDVSGRTTFVNTLCGKRVLQGKDADDASNAHIEEGVRIKPITVGTC